MLLRPALDQFKVQFATTDIGLAEREGICAVTQIADTNRSAPLSALKCAADCLRLVRETRPDFIITTGALPGLICLALGRLFGSQTIWLDSVANSEAVSLSGRVARLFVSLWLTQWEYLARSEDEYAGAVL